MSHRGEGVDGLVGRGVGLIEFRQQSESQRRALRFMAEAVWILLLERENFLARC